MKKINNILFLNPPDPSLLEGNKTFDYAYFEPPLGLMYVYAFAKDSGRYNCKFVDLSIELKSRLGADIKEVLKDITDNNKPDIVAISALYYSSISVFHEIVKIIKTIDKNIIIVMGGHYPTHLTDMCMKDINIDYAIISEGEESFVELVEAINESKDKEEIEGIVYRKGNYFVRNERKKFWSGFSTSGTLPWEDIEFDQYFKNSRNVLYRVKNKDDLKIATITATRGCPNECSFCSSPQFWKRRWRKREIKNVIDEIKYLINNHGINTIVFNDENLTVHKKWFLELLDEIKKLNITWISGGGLSIRTINDEEVIKAMYESGIGLFNLAVESSTDDNLEKIKKSLTIQETENVVSYIRKYGKAEIIGFFIVGFPWESIEDINYTINFAGGLDLDWKSFYCFQPFPGCELYDYCITNELMAEFNINYGENYFAPEFKRTDYSSDDLNKIVYTANLKYNFVDNRNLLKGDISSLEQAERDFKYVLDMAKDHVFALLGLYNVYNKLCKHDEANLYRKKAIEAYNNSNFDWNYYLEYFGINLSELAEES